MQCRELKADQMHLTTRCCTGMPPCEASRELVINSQRATRNRGELTVNSRLDPNSQLRLKLTYHRDCWEMEINPRQIWYI